MIEHIRTPEERFSRLPDFPFSPNYVSTLSGFDELRMHYIDEGRPHAEEVFLCLHGEPTWSYLYRKMVPVFVAAGHRVVAIDFFGFGRSDKPANEATYTFAFHRDSIWRFIEHLDLKNITLVCQDWGGVLGLTLPMDLPDRFSRLLVMNTILATGDEPLGKGFLDWRAWSNAHPDMEVAKLMRRTCPHLTAEESEAYAAPFPSAAFKAGVRAFPNLIADRPEADGAEVSRRARVWLQTEWKGDTFMAVGMKDPVLGPAVMDELRKTIRNCPPAFEMNHAGHFVPEWGDEAAREALAAFRNASK